MTNLVRKCGCLMAVAVLCFATSAFGTTVTLDLANGTRPAYGSYYVFPYGFHINGSPSFTPLICDDFMHAVSFGETWKATVTNLTALPGSNTPQFWTATGAGGPGDTKITLYKEAAWLTQQIFEGDLTLTQVTDLNYALWYLMDPRNPPGPLDAGAKADLNAALTHGSDPLSDFSDVWVYTWNGTAITGGTPPPQEFLGIPEARTSALLGVGLVALMLL